MSVDSARQLRQRVRDGYPWADALPSHVFCPWCGKVVDSAAHAGSVPQPLKCSWCRGALTPVGTPVGDRCGLSVGWWLAIVLAIVVAGSLVLGLGADAKLSYWFRYYSSPAVRDWDSKYNNPRPIWMEDGNPRDTPPPPPYESPPYPVLPWLLPVGLGAIGLASSYRRGRALNGLGERLGAGEVRLGRALAACDDRALGLLLQLEDLVTRLEVVEQAEEKVARSRLSENRSVYAAAGRILLEHAGVREALLLDFANHRRDLEALVAARRAEAAFQPNRYEADLVQIEEDRERLEAAADELAAAAEVAAQLKALGVDLPAAVDA